MKKFILSICILIFNFSKVFNSEYQIVDLGTDLLSNDISTYGINDLGQVSGLYEDRNDSDNQYFYLHDPKYGFIILDFPNEFLTEKDWRNKSIKKKLIPIKLNSSGQMLFKYKDGRENELLLWDENKGSKKIVLPWKICKINAFNDNGQIIGEYPNNKHNDTFHCDENGVINGIELLSIDMIIKMYGYSSFEIFDINNKGQIVGYVYGKMHGSFPFFWDGNKLSIIDNCDDLKIQDFNNKGEILLHNKVYCLITYIWSKKEGLRKFANNFTGFKINDSSTILGTKKVYRSREAESSFDRNDSQLYDIEFTILKNDQYMSLSNLVGHSLDNLSGAEGCKFKRIVNIIDINNKEQILAIGIIGDKKYPCIIQPKKD